MICSANNLHKRSAEAVCRAYHGGYSIFTNCISVFTNSVATTKIVENKNVVWYNKLIFYVTYINGEFI